MLLILQFFHSQEKFRKTEMLEKPTCHKSSQPSVRRPSSDKSSFMCCVSMFHSRYAGFTWAAKSVLPNVTSQDAGPSGYSPVQRKEQEEEPVPLDFSSSAAMHNEHCNRSADQNDYSRITSTQHKLLSSLPNHRAREAPCLSSREEDGDGLSARSGWGHLEIRFKMRHKREAKSAVEASVAPSWVCAEFRSLDGARPPPPPPDSPPDLMMTQLTTSRSPEMRASKDILSETVSTNLGRYSILILNITEIVFGISSLSRAKTPRKSTV